MKLFASAALGAAMFAGQAFAAALSIVGGADSTLPFDFHSPVAGVTADSSDGAGDGTAIKRFDHTNLNMAGLFLTGNSKLQFTFLSEEANASNSAVELVTNQSLTNNGVNNFGDSIYADFTNGFVSFKFKRNTAITGEIENGVGASGAAAANLNLAFLIEDGNNALAFFGDGSGNDDLDDMVLRITVVPLPAGMVLMLTALGGLGIARRRKTAA